MDSDSGLKLPAVSLMDQPYTTQLRLLSVSVSLYALFAQQRNCIFLLAIFLEDDSEGLRKKREEMFQNMNSEKQLDFSVSFGKRATSPSVKHSRSASWQQT